jgi:acetyl-CoA carboxylase, biotin carboxylase subunit
MFHKVLIANRGEIAVRVIRACRDLGIISAVVYSEPDRASLHVRLADEAYFLGPAPAAESYLNIGKVIEAARIAHADAIHPGYGFLSENPDFADACAEAGIVLIGPSARSMRLLGNKTSARAFVRQNNIRMVPGSYQPLASMEEALQLADALSYPVMVKAAAGGGGRGMRLVKSASEMSTAYVDAGAEALSSFGDASLYLEKYIAGPHHIEIQVLADRQGNAIYLGERECSLQRRNQKLLEESPSPFCDEALRREMGETALRVVRAAQYENAGTIEFLVDAERHFYFLEMNVRLQVEHPITEAITGVDLVCEQLRITAGEPLSLRQDQVQPRGWALECRICAEDPDNALSPSPGVIRRLQEPQGPGVRVDSGIYQGWEVTVDYDPLLAKLSTFGADRAQAIARMHRAIREYRIAGIKTNLPLFVEILSSPEFQAGNTYVGLFEEVRKRNSKTKTHPDSLFNSHALAAALAYADATEPSFQAPDQEAENSWKLSGRPGFSNAVRR